MAHNAMSSTTAFNTIPIELNKAIAHYLKTDKDIATYRLICRATNDAIDADNHSFWRTRFREKYAMKEGISNRQLMKRYRRRAFTLRRAAEYPFYRGHVSREHLAAKVLRDLIKESFHGVIDSDEDGHPYCKNQTHLMNFILNSKILLSDRRAPPAAPDEEEGIHPLLAAVKLMGSHFLFELDDLEQKVFGIEDAQRAVYLATNAAPIYTGPVKQTVNLTWTLQCLNFFRHHMMCEEPDTLYDVMRELPASQKPSRWREPLQLETKVLSKHWRGTYSYVNCHMRKKIRQQDPTQPLSEYINDHNIDEGKLQTLTLNFDTTDGSKKWPASFENYLQSLRNAPQCPYRSQGRRKVPEGMCKAMSGPQDIFFSGKGTDIDDKFSTVGWLNPLPPQEGIPGWMRITFMKHFMGDLGHGDHDNLWGYEGVVLPGGRIIVGRWWWCHPSTDLDEDINGPFIFWAVDPEEEEEEEAQSDNEGEEDGE